MSYFGPGHDVDQHNDVCWRVPGPEAAAEMEAKRQNRVIRGQEVNVFMLRQSV